MKREKWLKKYRKRWERVAKLYNTGKYTFEEIGEKIGVSRQRANQMYIQWSKAQEENQ